MDRSGDMAGAHAKRGQTPRETGRNPATGQDATGSRNTYDGPNDSESRGRSDSNARSGRARSQSRTASQTRAAQMEAAKSLQRTDQRQQQLLRNVDFGGNAYNLFAKVSVVISFALHSSLLSPFAHLHSP